MRTLRLVTEGNLETNGPGATPDRAARAREAARLLRRTRVASGLSQERVAELMKCGVRTVQRRERAQVDLGPLEQLLLLERLASKEEAA